MDTLSELWVSGGVAEIETLVFPFGDRLEAGETIAAVTVTCAVASGEDVLPQQVLVGAAQVVGQDVLQRVQGHVPGVVYKTVCMATTSTGRKLLMRALLPCAEA